MQNNVFELSQTTKELIKNLISRIKEIIKLLQSGHYNTGNERLIFVIDDMQILVKALMILHEEDAIDFPIEELNEKLNELVNQLENKDYLFVADLLSYELKPLLEQWDGCIKND